MVSVDLTPVKSLIESLLLLLLLRIAGACLLLLMVVNLLELTDGAKTRLSLNRRLLLQHSLLGCHVLSLLE